MPTSTPVQEPILRMSPAEHLEAIMELAHLVNTETSIREAHWADDVVRHGTGTARKRKKDPGEGKRLRELNRAISAAARDLLERWPLPISRP